jgi:uncharacterized protein YbbC (DUF1343 family)
MIKKTGRIHLSWLIESYTHLGHRKDFFRSFFYKLSGNKNLKKKIEEGWTEKQIRSSWEKDIENFMEIRKKYLLYEDFET